MEQPKQDHPYFWHGPAKVILTNLPTTVWVAHRGRIIKACPEHLRPVADEEKFILTDWIQDILDTKQKLMDKEYKGYIVLDEKPPDIMDMPSIIDKDFVGPLPPQVPSRKITGKHPPEEVEFKPDAYDIKRRRANQLHRDHCRWHQQHQRDQENNQPSELDQPEEITNEETAAESARDEIPQPVDDENQDRPLERGQIRAGEQLEEGAERTKQET